MTQEAEFYLALCETSVTARRAVCIEYTDLCAYSFASKGSFSYTDIKTVALELHAAIKTE